MPESPCNFLMEDLVTITGRDRTRRMMSLPGVLATLSGGGDVEFTHLQAHQLHAWHAFLVQLAALALHHAHADRPFTDDGAWRRALLGLTSEAMEPWCLVVHDLSKPALLQPPVPEGSFDGWATAACPDEIDLLVTAKNHDVKASRIQHPGADHWLYALVSVQTMDGFPGRNNYGIARMNGGYGNRACISTARNLSWSSRFVRDIEVIREVREATVSDLTFAASGGVGLLWLKPWDGKTSLAIRELDPWFIEICRRLRLANRGGTIRAYRTGTAVRRIDAEEHHGNLGDPWIPIRRDDGVALTAKSLAYDDLYKVLFEGWFKLPASAVSRSEDGNEPIILALIMVRGQGGTEGFHERTIPVPPRARRLFATPEGRQRLGMLAQQRVDDAAKVKRSVLKPALLTLVQGAPDVLDFKDSRVGPLLRQFDALVDTDFFAAIFADVDRDPGDAGPAFARGLIAHARAVLDEGMRSLPIPRARWYRAVSRAETVFRGASRRAFPEIYADAGGTGHEPSRTDQ